LTKKILLILTGLVIVVAAYLFWAEQQEFAAFKGYFAELEEIINTAVEDNRIQRDTEYGENMQAWNRQISARLDELYSEYRGDNRENIRRAVFLTRELFDEVLRLRNDFIPVVETMLSARMKDRQTLLDENVYQWRLGALEQTTEKLNRYDNRLEQIHEKWRVAMVESGLPEKYRTYLWKTWFSAVSGKLRMLGPEIDYFTAAAPALKQMFEFLYANRSYYYVKPDGEIVFTDLEYQKKYAQFLQVTGDW
jgi:hypothetical protein